MAAAPGLAAANISPSGQSRLRPPVPGAMTVVNRVLADASVNRIILAPEGVSEIVHGVVVWNARWGVCEAQPVRSARYAWPIWVVQFGTWTAAIYVRIDIKRCYCT